MFSFHAEIRASLETMNLRLERESKQPVGPNIKKAISFLSKQFRELLPTPDFVSPVLQSAADN